jgi:hypothetical protein
VETETTYKLLIHKGSRKLQFTATTQLVRERDLARLRSNLEHRSGFQIVLGGSPMRIPGGVMSRFQIADIENDAAAKAIESIVNAAGVAISDVEQQ